MPKFLVIAALGPTQPEAAASSQAAEKAKEWVRDQKRNGRLDVAYTYPGGGGCAIVDADSSEELQKLLVTNPASAFLSYTVHPLVDFDAGMDRVAAGRGGAW